MGVPHSDCRRMLCSCIHGRSDEDRGNDHWKTFKDRMATAAVITLLCLVFMMLDMSVINFGCSFSNFITFECNRWGQLWNASRGP